MGLYTDNNDNNPVYDLACSEFVAFDKIHSLVEISNAPEAQAKAEKTYLCATCDTLAYVKSLTWELNPDSGMTRGAQVAAGQKIMRRMQSTVDSVMSYVPDSLYDTVACSILMRYLRLLEEHYGELPKA